MDDVVTIMDLAIPFPQIHGRTDRQVWYANCLRNEYVKKHEQRFREIEEAMLRETDRRLHNLDEYDYLCEETFDDEYSNAERACLFGVDAGGIIAALIDEERG